MGGPHFPPLVQNTAGVIGCGDAPRPHGDRPVQFVRPGEIRRGPSTRPRPRGPRRPRVRLEPRHVRLPVRARPADAATDRGLGLRYHLDLTGRGLVLETATAIGAAPAIIAAHLDS